jgi:hypothetical protein
MSSSYVLKEGLPEEIVIEFMNSNLSFVTGGNPRHSGGGGAFYSVFYKPIQVRLLARGIVWLKHGSSVPGKAEGNERIVKEKPRGKGETTWKQGFSKIISEYIFLK